MTTNNIPFNHRPTRLSEAIRLGAAVTRPAKFNWIQKLQGGLASPVYTACAMGAAYIGTFAITEDIERGLNAAARTGVGTLKAALRETYPVLLKEAKHPEMMLGRNTWTVQDIIVSLNDSYHWTREQIADWVETIEDAQESRRKVQEREFAIY